MHSHAQTERPWEKYFHELSTIEDDESSSWQEIYDDLCELDEHPININTASKEDLERLPFLTGQQISDICEYIYKYGSMKTLGELQMIESLDYYRRNILLSFLYAGDNGKRGFPKLKNILKYGKQELLLSANIPFYSREGDENGYLGYKYKHSIRYSFHYGDYIKFGIVGAQDAGEPFFSNKNNMGYDHYSYYMMLRNIGRIKVLAIGCYKISFGMGLVLNSDLNLGKIVTLSSLGRSNNNIRVNSSRSESNYFQGIATTINITKGLTVSGFASYRKMDGTLKKDSTISSIITSGYHRTPEEMNKKHNMASTVFGGNIHYSEKGFHIGATSVYTSLDKELKPDTSTLYRRYYATGKQFYNISSDYGYINHKFSFNGETATGNTKAIATINSISYSASDNINIMVLQRYYSKKYTSLYGNSFSEGGTVQDENGIYIGASWRPNRLLNISGYTDFAYFVWPKYQAHEASHAIDNYISTTYSPGKFSIIMRYRLKIKQKDNADKTDLINQTQHRGKLAINYTHNDKLNLLTQADMTYVEYKDKSLGWMVSQNINYNHKKWLNLNGKFSYFKTDGYDSRIYTYERGLLYDFSLPMFYGEGIRYALLVKANINENVMITAKVGTTNYFDRVSIGSSSQRIDKSAITDLGMQLKWKF